MQLGCKSFLTGIGLLVLAAPCAHAQMQQATLRLEKDAVTARGRWNRTETRDGEERPQHLPLVEIHCYKVTSFCMQATATVHGGEPGLAMVIYQVVHWDKTGILAENQDFSCTTNQLKIDFKANSVMAMDSPRKKGKTVVEACKAIAHTIGYELIDESAEVSDGKTVPLPAQ